MFVDLHIHSCLSACADNDMTPNNIINMAQLKGLDMIAVTDHNCAKNQVAIDLVAKQKNMKLLYGIEVCTYEEVHVLVYFKELRQILEFDEWLSKQLLPINNNVEFYGQQLIMNHFDEVIGEHPTNLSLAITQPISQVFTKARQIQGVCVYAHAINKANSVIEQLGFISQQDPIKGIEVRSEKEHQEIIKRFPHLEQHYWYFNSDAHQLGAILERESWLNQRELSYLLGLSL